MSHSFSSDNGPRHLNTTSVTSDTPISYPPVFPAITFVVSCRTKNCLGKKTFFLRLLSPIIDCLRFGLLNRCSLVIPFYVAGCRSASTIPYLSPENSYSTIFCLTALYFVISQITFRMKLHISFLGTNYEYNFQIDINFT